MPFKKRQELKKNSEWMKHQKDSFPGLSFEGIVGRKNLLNTIYELVKDNHLYERRKRKEFKEKKLIPLDGKTKETLEKIMSVYHSGKKAGEKYGSVTLNIDTDIDPQTKKLIASGLYSDEAIVMQDVWRGTPHPDTIPYPTLNIKQKKIENEQTQQKTVGKEKINIPAPKDIPPAIEEETIKKVNYVRTPSENDLFREKLPNATEKDQDAYDAFLSIQQRSPKEIEAFLNGRVDL